MNDVVSTIILYCSVVTSLAAVIALIVNTVKMAKAPNAIQNQRIAQLEADVNKIKNLLDNDNRRIKSTEEGNRVVQHVLLAIVDHLLDGNDTEQLTKTRNDLREYLISR